MSGADLVAFKAAKARWDSQIGKTLCKRRTVGRPYATELAELPQTYRWAMKVDIGPLVTGLRHAASLPLVAIGSGGSLTVAEFAASLHRDVTGHPAIAQTPLDAVASRINFREAAVLMTSAGGSNPDVLGSFEITAGREPGSFLVVCLRRGTPLARRAARFPYVDFIELSPPTERDGFLTTNSLVALVTLLTRAYRAAFVAGDQLPRSWSQLVPRHKMTDLDRRLSTAWERKTLVALHGPSTRVAAVDLESRFTEAALHDVWIADYRNFAHGRHHWLAKRPYSTAVLAFVTPDDQDLALSTLALIPGSVPVVREEIPFSGPLAGIAALGRVIHVAAGGGRARTIDPGRPGVPAFGRRIYHLNAFRNRSPPPPEQTAIERKTGKAVETLSSLGVFNFWRDAYRTFTRAINDVTFKGVVIDYDGTLCGEADRFGDLHPRVVTELLRLLRGGIAVGVATGRGKSVRQALRKALPKNYWDRVVVGYYNGGDVGLLSDKRPDGSPRAGEALAEIADALGSNQLLTHLAKLELRLPQITIEPNRQSQAEDVWALVENVVQALRVPGTSLLRSSHSIDVLAAGVDKRAVVRRLNDLDGDSDWQVLCIGDRGRYPGNDHLLLSLPHSLSVDQTSPDPDTCWNLAPLGVRNVGACVHYLRTLRISRGGAHVGAIVRGGRR